MWNTNFYVQRIESMASEFVVQVAALISLFQVCLARHEWSVLTSKIRLETNVPAGAVPPRYVCQNRLK
jgi:hypothetical protein